MARRLPRHWQVFAQIYKWKKYSPVSDHHLASSDVVYVACSRVRGLIVRRTKLLRIAITDDFSKHAAECCTIALAKLS